MATRTPTHQHRATRLCFGTNAAVRSALIPGVMPPQEVRVFMPATPDHCANKRLEDPSNNVHASELVVGATSVPLVGSASSGARLTYNGTDLRWHRPGATLFGDNTYYGNDALASITTGTVNSAFGWHSLELVTTGKESTGAGAATMRNQDGEENTAIGAYALDAPAIVYSYSTAIGNSALREITSGSYITACGFAALSGFPPNSASRISCEAIGLGALGGVNTVVGATAIGDQAGIGHIIVVNTCIYGANAHMSGAPTTSSNNAIFGAYAASSSADVETSCIFGIDTATNPANPDIFDVCIFGARAAQRAPNRTCAFGFESLRDVTSTNNCAFGSRTASTATTATQNTIFGSLACESLTTGTLNTCVGYYSGGLVHGINDGQRNTLIGSGTDVDDPARNRTIAIGCEAVAGASNQLALASALYPINTRTTGIDAGAAGALPATPRLYLDVMVNGVLYCTPLYNI